MKLFILAVALAFSPAAMAQGAHSPPVCVSPQEFAEAPPIDPHSTLTGVALHQYIDAFNALGGRQGYDDFDQLDIYRSDSAVHWVFFKSGCMIDEPVLATPIHSKIIELLEGRGV